jgi:uracil-DNA glycosylase family 4
MQSSEEYKRQVLKQMGVDIWQFRDSPKHLSESTNTLGSPDIAVSASFKQLEPVVDQVPDSAQPCSATLDSVAIKISSCVRCRFHQTRSNTVPGAGNSQADWMFIGEAPGTSEDEKGLPFSGKSGKLLNAMLVALGMDRSEIFVSNILKCRPSENRDSLSEEMILCSEFIRAQINLIQPKVIIVMGELGAQSLLKTTDKMDSLRQQVHHYGSNSIPLIATFDPGSLMQSPELKMQAWADLLLARSSYRAALVI